MIDSSTMGELIKTSNGPIAVLFACMFLQKNRDKTYFTEREISNIMDRTEKTVRGHMRQLAHIGFVTHTKFGWTLTILGRQQLLEVAQFEIGPGNEPIFQPVKITGSTEEENSPTGKNYRCSPSNPFQPVNFTGENAVVVVNKDFKSFKDFKTQQQQESDEPVKITGDEEMGRILRIGEEICRSTHLILDCEIWPTKIIKWLFEYENRRHYHPENEIHGLSIICGWIAQLYEKQPAKINSSLASIVATNVVCGRKPQTEYVNHYWRYFTIEFQDQISTVVDCPFCWQDDEHCTCRRKAE